MSLSPVLFAAVALAIVHLAASEGNAVDEAIDDTEAAHPIYEFVYEVGQQKRPDQGGFGHKESRDGSRTWGTYFQQLSDGRLQTVKYWVDQTGYHAEVEYAGEPSEWEDGGKAKRHRLVARGQGARGDPSLVQALLDSFPKQSLQTKRSSATPEGGTAPEGGRITEGGRAPVRSALRPVPVNLYATRSGGRRGSGRSPGPRQSRRTQAPKGST